MANPLKQLAGQTVIYGLSTILARIINFLFVPIYTRVLSPESYGVVTEFMAYIAVGSIIILTFTGLDRFVPLFKLPSEPAVRIKKKDAENQAA